jgi:cell division protein FtsQ
MSVNWKNIMGKLAIVLVLILIIAGFVAANYFAKNNTYKGVHVKLDNADNANFITINDVTNATIKAKNITAGITKLSEIDINSLEHILVANPWVSHANIYIGNDDYLNINVTQKEPVLRLLNGDIAQNYLDNAGNIIPLHPDNYADVPIVTCTKLGFSFADQKVRKQLVGISSFISKDSFWNNMITQINVNDKKEIELIPVIANQIILFGDTSLMQNKFNRLFKFYKEAMPKVGAETYNNLNLKYAGQIIANKPLDSLGNIIQPNFLRKVKNVISTILPNKNKSKPRPLAKVEQKTAIFKNKPATKKTEPKIKNSANKPQLKPQH